MSARSRLTRILRHLGERLHYPIRLFVSLLPLLVGSVALVLVARSMVLGRSPNVFWRVLARSLGEAGLVAWALALGADWALKRSFAQELGRRLWGFLFGREVPDEYRKALEKLAAIDHYYQRVSWTLTFDWTEDEDLLRLGIRVLSTGVNLGEESYRPTDAAWLVASAGGRPSTYEYWRFEVLDPSHERESKREHDRTELLEFLETTPDGTTFLNQDRASRGVEVPSGARYQTERRATFYFPANGEIPLVQNVVVLQADITVMGEALPTLVLQAMYGAKIYREEDWSGQQRRKTITVGSVVLPGQATVISWNRQSP